MRHFRDEQRAEGRHVYYSELDNPANRGNVVDETRRWASALRPQRLIVLQPGDWRIRGGLAGLVLPIEFRADRHFFCLNLARKDSRELETIRKRASALKMQMTAETFL